MRPAIPLDSFCNAAVVHGDYAQLIRGMRWRFPRIESRMLFWCRSGAGRTWINGEAFDLSPGRFFIVPWGSDHAYEATSELGVGGVHVIPWYDPAERFSAYVAHSADSPFAGSATRKDLPCAGLEKTFVGRLDEHPVLARQAEYIVSWCKSGVCEEPIARALGPVVLWQWMQAATAADPQGLPPELIAVLSYFHGDGKPTATLDEFVRVGQVSRSTLIRYFRKYLKTTPHQWIADRQLREAEGLLRMTGLRVKEIAQKCGMEDPLYFSRWFRRRTGMSPRAFRASQRNVVPT